MAVKLPVGMPPRASKPRTRKQKAERPALAVGHVVLQVADTRVAAAFYQRLGLRPVCLSDDLAILELRGGTHLLLFPTASRRRARRKAPFDLMADDVDAAHAAAVAHGMSPSAIGHERRSGHRFFTLEDPDGHRLTVYSSHTEQRAV
jgi:catechol 2,3-dioxygenase-like lactoylglutathione lyase family enzyme